MVTKIAEWADYIVFFIYEQGKVYSYMYINTLDYVYRDGHIIIKHWHNDFYLHKVWKIVIFVYYFSTILQSPTVNFNIFFQAGTKKRFMKIC